MQWADTLIQEYGHHLGLDALALNHDGLAGLSFDNGDELVFELNNEQLLVSLLYPSTGYELLKELESLLQYCHYQKSPGLQVQPGLLGDSTLSLSVCIDRENATTSGLDTAILHLRYIAEQVSGRAS